MPTFLATYRTSYNNFVLHKSINDFCFKFIISNMISGEILGPYLGKFSINFVLLALLQVIEFHQRDHANKKME